MNFNLNYITEKTIRLIFLPFFAEVFFPQFTRKCGIGERVSARKKPGAPRPLPREKIIVRPPIFPSHFSLFCFICIYIKISKCAVLNETRCHLTSRTVSGETSRISFLRKCIKTAETPSQTLPDTSCKTCTKFTEHVVTECFRA